MSEMEFENVLEGTGGFGKFQKRLIIFFVAPVSFITSWYFLDVIFMLSVPEHWCFVPEASNLNLSLAEQRKLTSADTCSFYKRNYSALESISQQSFYNGSQTVPCDSGWQYDTTNYDSTVSTKWNLVCKDKHFPSIVFTLGYVGALIGGTLFGYLSDRYGRKPVFILAALMCPLLELCSALIPSFTAFAICRMLMGVFSSEVHALSYLIAVELVTPEYRGRMNGIISTVYTLGLCALPGIAYLARTWTNIAFVSAAAGLIAVSYICNVPESPCWLLSQSRYKEASSIFYKIAETNGKTINREELFLQLLSLAEHIKKKKLKEAEEAQPKTRLLRYPRLRRHFCMLVFAWTACVVVADGLMYNLVNLEGNEFLFFFLLGAVEFPGKLLFWFAMDRYGRRWTVTTGFLVIAVVCLLPLTGVSYGDVSTSLLARCLNSGTVMVAGQQAAELFPTVYRSFTMGLGRMLVMSVSLFVPFITHLAVYGKALPFLLIGLVCGIAAALTSFLPETLNENLPQTITDAENLGINQEYFSCYSFVKASEKVSAHETSIRRFSSNS